MLQSFNKRVTIGLPPTHTAIVAGTAAPPTANAVPAAADCRASTAYAGTARHETCSGYADGYEPRRSADAAAAPASATTTDGYSNHASGVESVAAAARSTTSAMGWANVARQWCTMRCTVGRSATGNLQRHCVAAYAAAATSRPRRCRVERIWWRPISIRALSSVRGD